MSTHNSIYNSMAVATVGAYLVGAPAPPLGARRVIVAAILDRYPRLECAARGHHDYPGLTIGGNSLQYCQVCGQEALGRTTADLTPLTDEEREQLMLEADCYG